MNIDKLDGIIAAIELESTNPNPSHANLARLVGLFCREVTVYLKDLIFTDAKPVEAPKTFDSVATTMIADVIPEAPKKKRGSKK